MRAGDGAKLLWACNPDESLKLTQISLVCGARLGIAQIGKPLQFWRNLS
jgi:hypothetical protein